MQSDTQTAPVSKTKLWLGRIISTLVVLFLLFDSILKLLKPAIVVEATVKLGYPESVIVGLGVVLLISTLLYVIPQTAILGAILLTGYLGGATATHVRLSESWFSILLPVILGVLLWGGLYLHDSRLQSLIPMRR